MAGTLNKGSTKEKGGRAYPDSNLQSFHMSTVLGTRCSMHPFCTPKNFIFRAARDFFYVEKEVAVGIPLRASGIGMFYKGM
jgi:hypothetical protein